MKLPFRTATALVTVEREGVLDSFVVPLSASSATVRLPIKANYAPNVVVSVLAVRGRVGDPAPTALVDLGKPAYKLGVASLRVGERGYALKVDVKTPQTVYKVRESVPVAIQVARADGGRLPAGAEVAVVAVDEALLELAPNPSWKLLDAMMATRPWEVDTATAQMQVVGKRHFGRKSLPPGGGGGKLPTRELFDTRVLWQARVKLDGNGRAQVKVPLNDSLTSFRIVAVAHAGTGFFGDGGTSIQTRQDVMLLSGLPPVVREGDAFDADFTVRNGSDKPQSVTLTPTLHANGTALAVSPRTVALARGRGASVSWPVSVPAGHDLAGLATRRQAAAAAATPQAEPAGAAGGADAGDAGDAAATRRQPRRAGRASRRCAGRPRRRGRSASRRRWRAIWPACATTCAPIPTPASSSACRARWRSTMRACGRMR